MICLMTDTIITYTYNLDAIYCRIWMDGFIHCIRFMIGHMHYLFNQWIGHIALIDCGNGLSLLTEYQSHK